jgi:hypothetical protein
MSWIGNRSAQEGEEQILVNLSMVRTITATAAANEKMFVVLDVGSERAVELMLTRERYSDLLRMLDMRDMS